MTDLAMRPVDREVHAAAMRTAPTDIVARLQTILGRDLVAVITSRTPRQVSRWTSGAVTPPRSEQQVLRDTLQVVELLVQAEDPEVVRAWFMGMNPQLEDQAPAEAIAAGEVRDVMAAARAFLNAG